jgi:NAD-dependent deacetylase
VKLVVLTGAGMSAESGLKTFRDMGGLWEEHDVMEVASIQGWESNPELVLKFYNDRRKQLESAEPNIGHKALVDLEEHFDVNIITQNVDNLHERAGSKNVLHLHGLLTEVKSTGDPSLVYDIGYKEVHWGDSCEKGHQLRPNIVWFGEPVPAIESAAYLSSQADIYAVIGTSLNVYPAAGLINYVPQDAPIYLIDPNDVMAPARRVEFIKAKAGTGVKKLAEILLNKK